MIKTVILQLHRWISLISGAVVFIVSITGAIFVFEEELFSLFHPELTNVEPIGRAKNITSLKNAAQAEIGCDKPIDFVFIYGDPKRAYCFSAFERNKHNRSIWDAGEYDHYKLVYVDQYTGNINGVLDKKNEFFYVVRRIHQHLLLRRDIGSVVTGTSTLLFLVILISGVVLWWPRNKRAFQQRIAIKWKARWRRVNYDLHNVLGFYVFLVAFLIAATGLVWSFDWWEDGIYNLLGSPKKEISLLFEKDTTATNPTLMAEQNALQDVLLKYTGLHRMSFKFPDESDTWISAFVNYRGPSVWYDTDYLYYDGNDGSLVKTVDQESKPLGLKWRNSNYYIHTGKIYGWPTQLLALSGSLICASLPLTGFIMWWGRKNKNGRKRTAVKRNTENISAIDGKKLRVPVSEIMDC